MFTSFYQACFEVLEQILKSYGTLLTSYQHLCLMMINNRYAFTCIGAVYYFNFAGTEEVVHPATAVWTATATQLDKASGSCIYLHDQDQLLFCQI